MAIVLVLNISSITIYNAYPFIFRFLRSTPHLKEPIPLVQNAGVKRYFASVCRATGEG